MEHQHIVYKSRVDKSAITRARATRLASQRYTSYPILIVSLVINASMQAKHEQHTGAFAQYCRRIALDTSAKKREQKLYSSFVN